MVKIETWTRLRKSHFCPVLTFDHDIDTNKCDIIVVSVVVVVVVVVVVGCCCISHFM